MMAHLVYDKKNFGFKKNTVSLQSWRKDSYHNGFCRSFYQMILVLLLRI